MLRKLMMTILISILACMAVIFGGGTALAAPTNNDTTVVAESELDPVDRALSNPDNVPTKLTYYVPGAGSSGKSPEGLVPASDGGWMRFVDYSANPLGMTASAKEGAAKLVNVIRPGADGVCRIGGYSLGTITIVKALPTIIESGICPKLDVQLAGSPNGAGSMATLLPDNFLVVFNQTELSDLVSDTVKITVVNMRSDGYASCLNQLSSVVSCVAGIFTGHYCAVVDLIPGQCYSDFTGEWTEELIDGVLYKTALTRNPVSVLAEYAGKILIGNDFGLSPLTDQIFELLFPQGSPGQLQSGVTPRDTLQAASSLLGAGR